MLMDRIKIVFLLGMATMLIILMPVTARIYREPVFKRAMQKTATLFFAPQNHKGSDLVVYLMLDPGAQAVNAVGTAISFSKDYLEVDSISKEDSACEFFMEEEFDNKTGMIRLSCATPTPGIEKKGVLAEITFKKKRNGWVRLNFDPESMTLANDGYSTNILKMLRNQKIYIAK